MVSVAIAHSSSLCMQRESWARRQCKSMLDLWPSCTRNRMREILDDERQKSGPHDWAERHRLAGNRSDSLHLSRPGYPGSIIGQAALARPARTLVWSGTSRWTSCSSSPCLWKSLGHCALQIRCDLTYLSLTAGCRLHTGNALTASRHSKGSRHMRRSDEAHYILCMVRGGNEKVVRLSSARSIETDE